MIQGRKVCTYAGHSQDNAVAKSDGLRFIELITRLKERQISQIHFYSWAGKFPYNGCNSI